MADSITRSLLIDEAKRRGWRVETIGLKDHFCKITRSDGRWEIFRGSRPMRSAANGFVIAKYKDLTMEFVENLGYKVPPYLLTDDETEAVEFAQDQGKIVIKPADGQRSEGVTVGVSLAEAVGPAMRFAQQFNTSNMNNKVLLQAQLEGNLYRLFVLDGELVAAAHRRAAAVVGDGRSNVRELIELANTDPRRGKGSDTPLKQINLEDAYEYVGPEKFESIPPAGEEVRVAAIESVSAGGESANVTSLVHANWLEVVGKIADEAGLFVCGFDVICDDIAQPLDGTFIPLLELNSSPGLKLHEFPTGGGEPIHIAPMLLDAVL